MSCVPKSRRSGSYQTDPFIVQDLNRSTEIQNPLLGHFFTFSTIYTEVMADLQRSNRCFRCARHESKYWNSVSTFGALLRYQYHSCEDIVYSSMDSNPELAQYVLYTEVTADLQKSYRCFHCGRHESKYWNSVSTFGALHHFQYNSCEEIVYFSMDFSTAFIQNILFTEVTAGMCGSVRLSAMSISLLMALLFVHFIAIFWSFV